MRLTCAFGSPWGPRDCGPCARCHAASAAHSRAFDRAVFFGDYNRRGYTEAEWMRAGYPRDTWRDACV